MQHSRKKRRGEFATEIRNTTRGALIKGTRHLPSEIVESVIFRKNLKELLKGYSGIYALYNGKESYYVGLTRKLLDRVNGHLKDRHQGQWNQFAIVRIRRVNYLKDIETLNNAPRPWPGIA